MDDLFGDLIGCGDIKLHVNKMWAKFALAKRVGGLNFRKVRMIRVFVPVSTVWSISRPSGSQAYSK